MKRLLLIILSLFIFIGCEKEYIEQEIPECEINQTGTYTVYNKSNNNILVDIVYEDDIGFTQPDSHGISCYIKLGKNDERLLKPGESTTYILLANVKIYGCANAVGIYNQWVIDEIIKLKICEDKNLGVI